MQLHLKNNKGFTLPELMVGMAMFAILVGLVTINLTGVHSSTNINTTIDTMVADIKQQQIKAMTGDTEGRASADSYGVHFDTTDYVLFHGTSYNASDTSNLTIDLSQGMQIIRLTHQEIIFNQGNGEIKDSSGSDTITLETPSGQQKTVTFNKYGAVTSIE